MGRESQRADSMATKQYRNKWQERRNFARNHAGETGIREMRKYDRAYSMVLLRMIDERCCDPDAIQYLHEMDRSMAFWIAKRNIGGFNDSEAGELNRVLDSLSEGAVDRPSSSCARIELAGIGSRLATMLDREGSVSYGREEYEELREAIFLKPLREITNGLTGGAIDNRGADEEWEEPGEPEVNAIATPLGLVRADAHDPATGAPGEMRAAGD